MTASNHDINTLWQQTKQQHEQRLLRLRRKAAEQRGMIETLKDDLSNSLREIGAIEGAVSMGESIFQELSKQVAADRDEALPESEAPALCVVKEEAEGE